MQVGNHIVNAPAKAHPVARHLAQFALFGANAEQEQVGIGVGLANHRPEGNEVVDPLFGGETADKHHHLRLGGNFQLGTEGGALLGRGGGKTARIHRIGNKTEPFGGHTNAHQLAVNLAANGDKVVYFAGKGAEPLVAEELLPQPLHIANGATAVGGDDDGHSPPFFGAHGRRGGRKEFVGVDELRPYFGNFLQTVMRKSERGGEFWPRHGQAMHSHPFDFLVGGQIGVAAGEDVDFDPDGLQGGGDGR